MVGWLDIIRRIHDRWIICDRLRCSCDRIGWGTMANKKYFWLKLKEDFFRDKKIKKLRRIAGGDTFTIIYLKMQLLALKHEGKLLYEGVEDNFAEELALEIDEDVDNVQVTLNYLSVNGLIEEVDQDTYMLPQTVACIGSEGSSAARVRKHREKKKKELEAPEKPAELPAPDNKVLQSNAQVTNCNTEIEKEKEKEIDIEKETDQQTDLDQHDRNHIDLIKDLFASWPVNDYQLLFIYRLAREQIPFTLGKSYDEYCIQVYDGLYKLTMQAKADGVTYIYKWMQKMIPISEF